VVHENHERWLVSYADFITLLFAFFVVMFGTSQTDHGKAQKMEESMRKALDTDQVVSRIAGILGGTPNDKGQGNAQWKGPGGVEKTAGEVAKYAELFPTMNFLNKQLEQEIAAGKMQITMQARGLVISFQQAAFFPSGDDHISEANFNIILKVAETIRELPNLVRFEGHTDSIPIRANGRFASNRELSAARAIAMMEALSTCCDLDSNRFSVAGYADKTSLADNSEEAGRQRNRRVDIVILNGTGASQEPSRNLQYRPWRTKSELFLVLPFATGYSEVL
jgi:chemotaxis protein MotB